MSDPANWDEPEGFVDRQIRLVSRRLLWSSGTIVGLLAAVAWLLWFYLRWFFHGPILVDDAYLLEAAKGPKSSLIAYVELRDHPLTPTGYVEESSQNGKVYSTTPYDFIAVGGRPMLVKGSPNAQGTKLIGPLESLTAKADQDAMAGIIAQNPQLRGRILPLILNAGAAFPVFGYLLIGMAAPILGFCCYNAARAVIHGGKTRMHPAWRMLARQGDPLEISRDIDVEMTEESVLKVGKAFVTRNWLLRPTLFGLIACRLDEIVWAYQAVVLRDDGVVLALRDGRTIGIPMSRNAPELLALVFRLVPWAERGWSKDQATRWQTQRANFLAQVDSRRGD